MRNKENALGALIGLILTSIGMGLFTLYFSEGALLDSLKLLYFQKKLGALISLGALLNLPVFFVLIRRKEYRIAYGQVGLLILLVALVALLKAF